MKEKSECVKIGKMEVESYPRQNLVRKSRNRELEINRCRQGLENE